jgi:hypothetical protein
MTDTAVATENGTKKPPYVAFATLESFIQRLKANEAVPPQIDKSMMTSMSGAVQSHLLATLRFLGLIDESKGDAVTQAMRDLVEAHGTEGFGVALKEVFVTAYSDVIGDIDVGVASAKQLDNAFMAHKLDGTMLDRAVRFYLKGMSVGGTKISAYLLKRKARGTGNGKPKKPKSPATPDATGNTGASDADSKTSAPAAPAAPKGTRPYPLYFKNDREGVLYVPTDLTAADCKVIELQLAVLRAYVGDETGG